MAVDPSTPSILATDAQQDVHSSPEDVSHASGGLDTQRRPPKRSKKADGKPPVMSTNFVNAIRQVRCYQRLEKKRLKIQQRLEQQKKNKQNESTHHLDTPSSLGNLTPRDPLTQESTHLLSSESSDSSYHELMGMHSTSLKCGGKSTEESLLEKSEKDHEDVPDSSAQFIWHMLTGKGIVSWLLLAAPLAIWAVYRNWSATAVFWLTFVVIIPLAGILSDFTEEAALHTNETIGGLINASFGNAVEVVVAIQALLANEIRVVQASMLGSIFSNLLLVLGCCFFFGGIRHSEQSFNATAATANMGLLALSSIALVLPTPFAEYYNLQDEHVLVISRIAAIFLIFMYAQLLVFQLHTHAYLFNEGNNDRDSQDSTTINQSDTDCEQHSGESCNYPDNGGPDVNTSAETDLPKHGADTEEEEELASIPFWLAITGLLTTTLMITFFSEFLVNSIDGFTEASGVSTTFVGIVLLPIVGNAVEHVTAVTVAMKDKMDLAMGVAIGSCTQISLFVTPLTVLVGWMLNRDMTLNFPHFEIILYVLAVLTVSIVLSTPHSNWLEGSLLITTYILIAVGFWFENVI